MTIELAAPTAEKVFAAVRFLPTSERLKLAALLITDVAPRELVDTSDTWSDEDLSDLDRATAQLIDERFGPEPGNYDD